MAKYYGVALSSYDMNRLEHYGVAGQNWGIRRYQNKDGSLTDAGKQHYGISSDGNKALTKKYNKEMAKLAKYWERQDVDSQAMKVATYKQKAKKAENVRNVATAIAAPLASVSIINRNNPFYKLKEPFIVPVVTKTSAAVAVGAGVAHAAYKLKKNAAEKRLTDIGHAKAKAKYEAQYNKMLKTFEGTSYVDILKKYSPYN